jgi:DNA polymerase elongation subunit (family B)
LQVQQTLDATTQASLERPKHFAMGSDSKAALRAKLKELTAECKELGPSILVSATYDGERRVAVLKFYEPSSERVYLWSDHSGHKPHCISKLPVSDLLYLKKERSNILDIIPIKKRDLIHDKEITVSKIITSDPLAIGGQENSLRNAITAWEADIKYYENYLYDNGLYMGAFYKIQNGQLTPAPFDTPPEVQESLKRALKAAKPEMARQIEQWASLLNQPLPFLKRAALDIEVLSLENRIPNPDIADQPVVAASLVSDKAQRIYLLDRRDVELGKREDIPVGAEILFFAKESDLLIKLFSDVLDYPFIATFNGDDFDLSYLYHRAQRPEIGLTKEEIPIILGNNFGGIKHGVHIDLYKTFNNRSLQIYAFGNKYSDHTLNGVAEGLLDESKIEFDGLIGDLPIYELAKYNLQDTLLTYKLVSIYNDVLLKLLVVIARVGKMPIDDLSRLGVSNWIRSMLYFEHRKQNALIPRPEELKEKGGAKSEAIIKGKKYKGGLVIDPISGVHFNVSVLDFASLYPSIIKVHNISYETVNCPHPECRLNVIPEVGHWTCTKNVGIESLVVGSLRDLRVDYYKQLTKSKTLSKQDLELYKVVSQGLKVIINACFTGDTEVLTADGIKNIKDLRVGDKVVNVNPITLAPEIDEVIETQEFPYDDEIYRFRNRKQLDLKVTKNHRFLVQQGHRSPSFMEAREIEKWTNVSIPRINAPVIAKDEALISIADYRGVDKFVIAFPVAVGGPDVDSMFAELWECASKLGNYFNQSRSFQCDELSPAQINRIKSLGGEVYLTSGKLWYPFEFKLSDFAELCGWIISEGRIGGTAEEFHEKGNRGGLDYGVHIGQEYGSGNTQGDVFRGEVSSLLQRMNLKHKQSRNGFRIANPVLHRFCAKEIGQAAKSRRIPHQLLRSSLYAKQKLMLALTKGGGDMRFPRYNTSSQILADQFCSLIAQLGYRPKKVAEMLPDESAIYRISWNCSAIGLTEAGKDSHKWLSKEKYNGRVYCITTRRNHTVFAGRNGIFAPVGQSYGVLGFESFPLYCLPAAEAVASLGRYSITKTIEECRSMGITVVYSDSVGSDSLIRVGSGVGEKYLDVFGSSKSPQLLLVKESNAETTEVTRIANVFRRVDRTGYDGREYYFPEDLHVETLDESGRAAWGKVKYVMRHKTPKQVYRVWLTNHWSLDVTEDHSLIGYVNTRRKAETDVMKRLVEVKPREIGSSKDSVKSLIVRKQYPRFSIVSREYPRVLYEFMGFFTGEGCFHFNSDKKCYYLGLAFGEEKAELTRSLVEPLRERGFVRNYWSQGEKGDVILNGLNLVSLFQKEFRNSNGRKRIPHFMFRETTENIFAFLRGLFSSVGTVKLTHGSPLVRFATTEEDLALQVRDLLWEAGISNYVFRENTKNSCKGKPSGTYSYQIVVKSVEIFKSSVRFLTQAKNRRLDLYKPGQGKRLFRNKEFDLSPVEKVEPIPYDDYVYDIEVEGSHRFVANGVLVHNTDSLFIKAASQTQIDQVSAWTQKQLGIEIEVDKVYRYVAMSQRKKNYFGVLQDGTVDIKGLTGKKSQTPEFIKNSFNEILTILTKVKSEQDFDQAREEIKTRLKSDYQKLRNKEISMQDLAFNVMIGKDIGSYKDTIPQHVRAAQILRDSGKEIKAGDIISFVKTTTGDGAKPAAIARKDEVDVEKYVEYMRSTFDQILGSLGYDFDEILGATKLEDFFWPSS